MRHVVVDEWSRGSSPLHRRDPRAKLVCLLIVLLSISLEGAGLAERLACAVALTAAGLVAARVPVGPFLLRSAVVLPFAGVLALTIAIGGDPRRATLVLLRSWLSASAILLLAATTPLPQLLHALRAFAVPALLVEIIQFVHRYLFVLAEQAWRMRSAAAARAGRSSYRAAAGTVTMLFARSYDRAARIHRAMLSRGYTGELPVSAALKTHLSDYLMIAGVSLCCAAPVLPALYAAAHLRP